MRHSYALRSFPLRLIMALVLLVGLTVQAVRLPAGAVATALAAGPTISTTGGQPGSAVTLGAPSGTFDGGSPVSVRFQDSNPTHTVTQVLATRNADPNGSFTATVLVPKPASGGTASFSLLGQLLTLLYTNSTTLQPVYAEVPVTPRFSFLVLPALTLLGNTHAAPGGTVQVVGDGYNVNSILMNFKVGGLVAAAQGAPIATDSYGYFVATLFVPVPLAPGPSTIVATDSVGATATLSGFAVDALGGPTATATPIPTATATGGPTASKLLLQPSSGPPGFAGLALIGTSGALPGVSAATVFFTDAVGNPVQLLGTLSVDSASGAFSGRVTIPTQAAGGTALIQVIGGANIAFAQFTITPAITLSYSQILPGGTVTITGSGFAPHRLIALTANGNGIQASTAAITDGFGSFTAIVTIPAAGLLGNVSIVAGDGTTNAPAVAVQVQTPPTATATPSPTATATMLATATTSPISTPLSGGPTSAYFAEGYTGQAVTNGTASFTEVLDIFNPGGASALATITYYTQGAQQPLTISRSVAAGSVLRESVNSDVGLDRIVAALVASPQRLYVTRTITRISPLGVRLDGSTAQPVSGPATSWGFPEGYTGVTFQQYLTVLNPGDTQANVMVLLAPQAASARNARTVRLVVPARGRATANIRALNLDSTAKSVGMLISSDQPIVPERVIYFGDGSGSGKFGSTVSSGSTAAAAQTLHLGYGTSGGLKANGDALGDQQYITLLNPNLSGAPAQVTANFVDSLGRSIGNAQVVTVAAGTRQTVRVNQALGRSPIGPFSTILSATAPIEAEAAQYYGGSPNLGRHPGVAFLPARTSGSSLFLSDLSTLLADRSPMQRTVYLQNPGPVAIAVSATYYGSNGVVAVKSYTVPAGGIATIDVNAAVSTSLSPGPIGATFSPIGGGSLSAVAIGKTLDGQSAIEDVGIPA